jgi:hypothetical protein
MKISKTVVLILWWFFTLLGLWLMFASAADKDLWMNPENAVHHVINVQLLSGSDRSTLSRDAAGILWIKANNFVISQTWDSEVNNVDKNATYSNILWWIDNKIVWWSYNSILGWQHNEGNWNYSTILWWSGNIIQWWSSNSVIVWWLDNTLKWQYSVVWGQGNTLNGNYSTVLWNNSDLNGNYSVALWSGAKNKANYSFLWTDGNQDGELKDNHVFAVVSQHGLVVNTWKAHNFAQLTVWGPLIIYNRHEDKDLVCNDRTKWVLKVMNGDNENSNQTCICSCDWESWHSLYWQWVCLRKCGTQTPKCAKKVVKDCSTYPYTYRWFCERGRVVEWMWAYVVTKDDKVLRSCQTNDWAIDSCSWSVTDVEGVCS